MWKRWLPILLTAEVFCLVVAAGLAVHRHAVEQAPPPRIVPAEWSDKSADSPTSAAVVAPPVPFRTDHPPAGAFNLRPIGPNDATNHPSGNLEVRSPQAPAAELPPDMRSFESNGATVFYEPLRR